MFFEVLLAVLVEFVFNSLSRRSLEYLLMGGSAETLKKNYFLNK
jgi:hypothetical protein